MLESKNEPSTVVRADWQSGEIKDAYFILRMCSEKNWSGMLLSNLPITWIYKTFILHDTNYVTIHHSPFFWVVSEYISVSIIIYYE